LISVRRLLVPFADIAGNAFTKPHLRSGFTRSKHLEGTGMGSTFLVAVDGSLQGLKAIELAITLAKASDAELVLVHVVPIEPDPEGLERWANVEDLSAEELRARIHRNRTLGDNITREAETRAKDAGLSHVSSRVAEGNVAKEIVDVAMETEADMVFLGSRGLSDVQGLLLGSIAHKVSHLAPCTCVLVK
jgi:nucleotide-binding universal stress UspA family protein